jgi:hypothetical protein
MAMAMAMAMTITITIAMKSNGNSNGNDKTHHASFITHLHHHDTAQVNACGILLLVARSKSSPNLHR